ncbi:nicotinate-nucleotide adenylyltransferase [Chloroflexota bacterium]
MTGYIAGIMSGSGNEMNIGVLGGTFDPIHKGHLAVAEETRNRLSLAEVLFVPAGQPQLKENRPIASAEHRVKMVRLSIADKPYFKLSTLEVERTGPSYTVDTMAELKGKLGDGDEPFFILGVGSLVELPRWKEPSRLIQICWLVGVPRPGYPASDLNALETVIPGLSQRVILLDAPLIAISSSDIRDRVAHGLSISHLVPKPVERVIKENTLYARQT